MNNANIIAAIEVLKAAKELLPIIIHERHPFGICKDYCKGCTIHHRVMSLIDITEQLVKQSLKTSNHWA